VGNSQEPGNIAPAIIVASSCVRERGVKSAGLNGTLLCPRNYLAFLRSSLSPIRALIVCIGRKVRTSKRTPHFTITTIKGLNLNSVNQLIFVMVKCGILFEVRTEFLNNI
jgi:hypothetical protein